MFGIGFEKWDLLLIRFKQNSDELDVGYVRYFLRDELEPTKFETREEAEKVLEILKTKDINFVNDSVTNSIVNGSNIDKTKLKIFKLD